MRVGITDCDGCPPPRKGATRDPDRRPVPHHPPRDRAQPLGLAGRRPPAGRGEAEPAPDRGRRHGGAARARGGAAGAGGRQARHAGPGGPLLRGGTGRDGFWLHRLLTAEGVAAYVLEPTSILVNRRARRAKTDRLDALGMLRVLAAYLGGDRQACSMVRVPTPEEEDAKRPHREREELVRERVRLENRIAALRTGDGRPLPPHLRAELDRLRRRLVLTLGLIRELEAERDAALAAGPRDAAGRKIAALCRLRGVGANFAAVLTREVFYRAFDNRRQLAGYVGLAPVPHQSGEADRDRRISRAGNARARTTLIQLAWLWLRYQPDSAPARWFRDRVGALRGRTRRIAIVAMARKLLVALWRYVETGLVPEGVEVAA